MPRVGLAGAGPEAGKDLQHHVEAPGVGLDPAVDHGARISSRGVDEDHRLAVDTQERGAARVIREDVAKVRLDLRHGGVAGPLWFVVERPLEGVARVGQQQRYAAVGRASLAPPRRDAGLDPGAQHGADLRGDDRRIR